MTDTKELIEQLRELAAGSWNTTCAEAADLLERQSEAVGRLVEALEEIARQSTSLELVVEDEFQGGDFVDGYDCCVNRARRALTQYQEQA